MAVVLGELETTATGLFRAYSIEPFLFLKGFWLLAIFGLVELLCWWDQTSLFLLQGMTKSVEIMIVDDITFLPFVFLAAFIIQVIFTLGVFVFSLWYDSRFSISSFKGEFFKVSSSINKLCGLCFYVILYLIAVYTTNKLAVSFSAHYEPLMKMYFEIGYKKEPLLGTFWDYLTIGCCMIIPAVTYFSLLGNLARNLESEELKRIEYKKVRANTLEEKNYLIHYMSEVRRSLRTVSIIDYIARLILISYLGIFVRSFLLQLPITG